MKIRIENGVVYIESELRRFIIVPNGENLDINSEYSELYMCPLAENRIVISCTPDPILKAKKLKRD
jgi:hypothetical protein